MKDLKEFIGRNLNEAEVLSMNPKGVVVFLLESDQDECGKRAAENYSVKLLLEKRPDLAYKKILYAEDFYGQDIFRVF